MAASATMAGVVSVSGAQLQGGVSSSFVNGGSKVVMPVSAPRSLKCRMVARASSQSESRDETRAARREILAGLMAAGAFLVGDSAARAVAGPGNDGAGQTAKGADDLLKAADKLNVEDAPSRFGPSQLANSGNGQLGDAGKVAQQAGSGAIEGLQSSASDIGEAAKSNLEEAKRRTEGVLGSSQDITGSLADKAEEAKQGVEGLFGQTQSSGNDVQKTAKNIFGQVQSKVSSDTDSVGKLAQGTSNDAQNLVGQAQSKVSGEADSAKKEAGGFFGSLQDTLKGLTDTVASKGDEAKNAAEQASGNLQKSLQ